MSDTTDRERWVTVAEAATLLDKSARTIRRMVSDGRLSGQRVDRRIMVNVAPVLPSDDNIDNLRSEVDILRTRVAVLEQQVDMLTGERDYLRQALATALRLAQPAIEAPRRRRWWPPWGGD